MKKIFAVIFSVLMLFTALTSCKQKPGIPVNPSGTPTASAQTTEEPSGSAHETSETGTPSPTDPTSPADPTVSGDTPLPTTGETPTAPTDTPSPVFTYIEKSPEDLRTVSPLFAGEAPEGVATVNVFENCSAGNGNKIRVSAIALEIQRDALSAFDKLQLSLNTEYPNYSIIFVACHSRDGSGLRCSGLPFEVAEHRTGYAADLWYAVKQGGNTVSLQINDAAAAAQTALFLPRAAALGIIQCCANIPGSAPDDLRHFRYVGIPHASYIYAHSMSLEGYLELLRSHPATNPLSVTADGAVYAVWYAPAEPDGSASIPVPENVEAQIFSDGVGGYVVSCVTSGEVPVDPPTETPIVPSTETPSETRDPSKPVIYIDAGHGFASRSGIYDNGAGENSPYFTKSVQKVGHGQYEADLDLQIALIVERMLKEEGYTVLMSRTAPSNERLPIADRAARAGAAGADLLVSIHANAAENPGARGARIYYNTEYSKTAESKALATAVGSAIDRYCPSTAPTALVDGKSLAMLNGTGSIPSILVETCFLTNEKDAENALDELWRENMARAIVAGILA